MSLVVTMGQGTDDAALREGAEWCVRQYAESATAVSSGAEVSLKEHVSLQLQESGRKSFFIQIDAPTNIGLYAQHTAEEFDMKLLRVDDATEISATMERVWVAQHEHDDEVGSFAIERDGNVDPDRLNAWLSEVLRERGVDIFRMKGFLSIEGDPNRFVFQGVHMLFDGQPDKPWGDAPRLNQLVFIGRNLDEDAMTKGFDACLV
jgi:G3E family GTPase